MNIPDSFYRISLKALILDQTQTKFMLVKEDNGYWELPGGGLDFGESSPDCLKRELLEEMNLTLDYISPNPSYFFTWLDKGMYRANVVYKCNVSDFQSFKPSRECQEYKFFNKQESEKLNLYPSAIKLLEMIANKL